MRKFFLVVAALGMLATACTKDDAVSGGNESLVSFTIDSPELATRYGEGTTATNLEWAFYDETGEKLDAISSSIDNFTGAYTLTVALVDGRQYTALFWASAPDAPYTVNWEGKTMTIDNTNLTANNEAYDAFYNYSSIDPAKKTHKIELTRPFAQVNIATADTADATAAGVTVATTQVAVVQSYKTLNFVDGSVSDKADFTYKWAAKATGTVTVGGKDYDMLSMNYVLVNERELVDVTMLASENTDGSNEITRSYTTVPVQRNYRTYIVGNLLTTSNEFEVETKPGFDGEEIYEVWDGETKTKPAYDADTKTYTVKTGAELAWLADLVNGTLPATMRSTEYAAADNLAGEIIELTDNIDLGGNEWTPIGCDKNHFKGTFEGNDYIISNFKITKRHNSDRAALFGTVSGTVAFRNFTIQNASVVCPDFDADFYGAGLIGTFYGNVTIEKVHVKDSYISGNNKVGALVAHDGVCSALKINNCSAEGVTFEATNKVDGGLVGGLVGFFQGAANGEYYVKNSSVKNCNFNVVNSTNTGKRANAQLVGGISSKANQTLVIENCEVADNTWNEKFYVKGVEVTVDTLEPLYGVYVGGERNDSLVGELIVDGVKVIANGIGEDAEGNHVVSSEAGLEYIAEQVNSGNTDWTDADIVLSGDIDLASFVTRSAATSNWTPIGTLENPFTGSFNGNGNTIKNLCIVETEAKEGKAYIGFFGYAKNVEIKNVTFENVYLDIACLDIDHSQGHIGAVAGSLEGTSTIENVTVKGDVKVEATFDANGASRVAVVAGGNEGGNVTMKNVHVIANEGSYLKANNNVGALAGQLQVKNVFENCSSNIDVTAKKFYAGGIIGLAAGDSKFTNCHTTGNITVTAGREGRHNDEYRVGGIAGGWADNVKTPCVLENCSYTGVISGTNADGAVANPLDYAGYVGRGYTLTNLAGSTVIIDGAKYIQAYNDVYGIYYYVGAIFEVDGVKAIIFSVEDGIKAVSVDEITLANKNWQYAMDWAAGLGEGWALASMEDLNAIYDVRCELNDALEADSAENALFWEGDELYVKNGSIYYACYISSDEAPAGETDPKGEEYWANQVFMKFFNARGYNDYLYSAMDCINKYAPLRDNNFARGVVTIK